MGRLIDADAFKRRVAGMAISNNYPANKANAWCELIDEQPTAYDVDKVVEQLEERSKEYNSGVRLHGKPEEMLTDDAIEIVKGGGVDAKTDF